MPGSPQGWSWSRAMSHLPLGIARKEGSNTNSDTNALAAEAEDNRGIGLLKVVQGVFYQGNEQFLYGGLQCMAIAFGQFSQTHGEQCDLMGEA